MRAMNPFRTENIPLRLYRFAVLLVVTLPFLGTLLAIYLSWNKYVFLSDIILMLAMIFFTGIGVTVGYHRFLTHNGFKTYAPIKAFLLICGAMAFEGAPLGWTGRHTQHHAHSDEEGDPHSPLDGFWHAHMGWMFTVPDPLLIHQYASEQAKDPVIAWVDRYSVLWMTLSLVIPFAIGGWTGLVWGGAVRIFFTTHMTWSVNSICHVFGKRDFETTDESRNNWVVGVLAFGEGWHNNHHAFPRNAFHGIRWWQFDVSGLLIKGLERVGLVWEVQRVSDETIEAQKIRALSMQETLGQLREQLSAKISHSQTELMDWIERHGRPRLTDAEVASATAACEEAVRRLQEIREGVAKATHLKKQRLLIYMNEVQQLAENARSQTQFALARVEVRS